MIARSRNPPESITPTILSDKPKPYTGAVWMKVIPRSIADGIVDIARSRSPVLPPQAQPPIASVSSPMREAAIPDVPISIVSMAHSFIS